MIAIINTGQTKLGNHIYNVQINKDLITTFIHNRADGLARCLELAASAVRTQEIREIISLADESADRNFNSLNNHELVFKR